MPQISLLVLDQRLSTEVATCEEKVLLARQALRVLEQLIVATQVDIAAAHVGVFNDAIAQAQQALDNVQAALVGGTHPRAVELTTIDVPPLQLWLDDVLTQSVAFEAALVALNGPGALALIPDMQAALGDAQTAVRNCAGVVDSPSISAVKLEDVEALDLVDNPLTTVVVLDVTGLRRAWPAAYGPAPVVEQVRARQRSAEETAWGEALAARQAEEARRVVVVLVAPAMVLRGMRL